MAQTIKYDSSFVPWSHQVPLGQTTFDHIFKFGYNAAVGNTSETIWAQGDLYTWPAAAATLELTSSSTADDADVGGGTPGTGALTVTIYGLDANYAEISETVTMNGQTAVNTANQYLRLHRMVVASAGSGGVNAGDIYASTGDQTVGVPDVATTIRSKIVAGDGQTLQAFYTIPAGKKGLLEEFLVSAHDNTNWVTAELWARPFGGAWNIKYRFMTFKATVDISPTIPLIFDEKTDVEIRATSNTSTVITSADMSIVLVDA